MFCKYNVRIHTKGNKLYISSVDILTALRISEVNINILRYELLKRHDTYFKNVKDFIDMKQFDILIKVLNAKCETLNTTKKEIGDLYKHLFTNELFLRAKHKQAIDIFENLGSPKALDFLERHFSNILRKIGIPKYDTECKYTETNKDIDKNPIIYTNSQDVTTYNNDMFGSVRVIKNENDEPLFCLSDICKVLGIQNATDVANALCREFELPRLNLGSFDTGRGIKQFNMIDEAQLCYLLNISRSPKAKPLRMWITKEVLPSIKNTLVKQPIADNIVGKGGVSKFGGTHINPQNRQSNDLKVYNFGNIILDYGLLNGEPIFNLNAIGAYLEIVNPRASINTNDKDYCIKVNNSAVDLTYNRILNNNGELFLTEAGLYKMIMRSRSEKAEPFQKWITKEVLPSIRKTGSYNINQFKVPQTYGEALLEAGRLALENEKLLKDNTDKQNRLDCYAEIHKARRSKQELRSRFNNVVRRIAQDRNIPYSEVYNHIYNIFAKIHNFVDTKIDIDFISRNMKYLEECLEIALAEINGVADE